MMEARLPDTAKDTCKGVQELSHPHLCLPNLASLPRVWRGGCFSQCHLHHEQGAQGKSEDFREVKSVYRMQQLWGHEEEIRVAFVWHKWQDEEIKELSSEKDYEKPRKIKSNEEFPEWTTGTHYTQWFSRGVRERWHSNLGLWFRVRLALTIFCRD